MLLRLPLQRTAKAALVLGLAALALQAQVRVVPTPTTPMVFGAHHLGADSFLVGGYFCDASLAPGEAMDKQSAAFLGLLTDSGLQALHLLPPGCDSCSSRVTQVKEQGGTLYALVVGSGATFIRNTLYRLGADWSFQDSALFTNPPFDSLAYFTDFAVNGNQAIVAGRKYVDYAVVTYSEFGDFPCYTEKYFSAFGTVLGAESRNGGLAMRYMVYNRLVTAAHDTNVWYQFNVDTLITTPQGEAAITYYQGAMGWLGDSVLVVSATAYWGAQKRFLFIRADGGPTQVSTLTLPGERVWYSHFHTDAVSPDGRVYTCWAEPADTSAPYFLGRPPSGPTLLHVSQVAFEPEVGAAWLYYWRRTVDADRSYWPQVSCPTQDRGVAVLGNCGIPGQGDYHRHLFVLRLDSLGNPLGAPAALPEPPAGPLALRPWPNPLPQGQALQLSAPASGCVMDAQGRELARFRNTHLLPTHHLPPGLYTLRLAGGQHARFVVAE